ncbi:hypothetical protein ACWCQM_24185 [Streptomyces sp. NPDC002125]
MPAGAPERIRAGVKDPAFLAQTKPWLDALDLWGSSLNATLAGLRDRLHEGDGQAEFAEAADLAKRAAAITTIPGTTRPQGTIKVADGVLDTFIEQAPTLRHPPRAPKRGARGRSHDRAASSQSASAASGRDG